MKGKKTCVLMNKKEDMYSWNMCLYISDIFWTWIMVGYKNNTITSSSWLKHSCMCAVEFDLESIWIEYILKKEKVHLLRR